MKKITIVGHIFEVQDNAYNFLEKYLQRIDAYATTHGIKSDIVDDIKYSIVEKLYACESPIDEKHVIQVANNIGEPEDIFADGGEDSDVKPTKGGFLAREKPVIWGVCYWLAKTLSIPVLVVRLIFLVAAIVYGTGFWIYIILAIFVPYQEKKKTTGFVGNIFFEIVRIALWLFLLSILFPMMMGAILGTGIVVFTPAFDGQSVMSLIPTYMYWVLGAITLALIVLFVGALGGLLKQKRITKTLALFSSVVVLVGGIITIGTAYKIGLTMVKNYGPVEHQITPITGELASGSTVNITVKGNVREDFPEVLYTMTMRQNISFVPATGNQISVETNTSMSMLSEVEKQERIKQLSAVQIKGTGENIEIILPETVFADKGSFAFVERDIRIKVPTNIILNIDNQSDTSLGLRRYYNDPIVVGKFGSCLDNSLYIYNAQLDDFVCKNIKRVDPEIDFDDEGEYRRTRPKHQYNPQYNNMPVEQYDNQNNSGQSTNTGVTN